MMFNTVVFTVGGKVRLIVMLSLFKFVPVWPAVLDCVILENI